MDEQYITLRELASWVAVFQGPFLAAGAIAQFALLRTARLRRGFALLGAGVGFVVTLGGALLFTQVLPPPQFTMGPFVLIVPALLSVAVVTLAAGGYAWKRTRKPAA
jgi:hypothetical protein